MDEKDSEKTRSDRRQFLTAEPIRRWWNRVEPISPVSEKVERLSDSGAGVKPGFLLELNKTAMACQWDVFLNYGQYPQATESVLHALGRLDELEDQLSVFRPESELSRINALAGFREVQVSDSLWDLLSVCRELSAATGGAFDISSGPLSELWGFSRRDGQVPTADQITESLHSVGLDKVAWDSAKKTIRFANPKVQLNLGGIGKGFGLDQCRAKLEEAGIGNFAIHGGQSSVVAVGEKVASRESDGSLIGEPWSVSLADPIRPEKKIGRFELNGQALGTSGSARQFFHHRGKRYSHIFDPRTGVPAEGVLSSTVIAPNATLADALATTCFVLGAEGCRKLCQDLPELAVLLVLPKGSSSFEIVKFGPMDQFWVPNTRNRKEHH